MRALAPALPALLPMKYFGVWFGMDWMGAEAKPPTGTRKSSCTSAFAKEAQKEVSLFPWIQSGLLPAKTTWPPTFPRPT